jgi:GNAT superfamily N-acetyltransferase
VEKMELFFPLPSDRTHFAAGRCIAQLHVYRVTLPDWDDSLFPGYARSRLQDCPIGWPLLAAKKIGLSYGKPVLAFSCFHVGLLPGTFDEDPRYFRRGIGTALLKEAVSWAGMNGYAAIIAHGGSRNLPAYNIWMGSMPWTAYRDAGFRTMAIEEDGICLPWWKDKEYPDLDRQLNLAMGQGCGPEELCARLMVLEL